MKKKSCISILAVLFIVCLLLEILPTTVFAQANIPENDYEYYENDDSSLSLFDTPLKTDSVEYLEEGSYTYRSLPPNAPIIENAKGVLVINNGEAEIHFEHYKVSLPKFDIYKIIDGKDHVKYYQADVAKYPDNENNFAFIALYVEYNSIYKLKVHYGIRSINRLYNISIVLDEEQFLFFDEQAVPMKMGKDEISYRLRQSANVITQCLNNDPVSIPLSNNIPEILTQNNSHNYDSYTDTDGIIHQYVHSTPIPDPMNLDVPLTDDPIVQIIPKELCFIPGEHIYIGKEYGFYIHVFQDEEFDDTYAVDVLIFDITHETPSFPSLSTGSSKVTPLFQFRYLATEANNPIFSIDSSLSCVVFLHFRRYDAPEYFLNEIGFKFSLDNPTALNPGDEGYDPYQDDGAFIIQSRLNTSGVGTKKKNGNFIEDTALFVLGYVKYVDTILSAYSYVYDLYNGFGNRDYFYTRSVSVYNNESYINTYETNSTDQINNRGNLVKAVSATLVADNEAPTIIHVGGGYAEAKYVVSRKSGSNNDAIRVTTSISVNVVTDDTSRWWLFGWHEDGIITDHIRATGTYETGEYSRLTDILYVDAYQGIGIPASGKKQIVVFSPDISGSYRIFTSSTQGDPNFYIYNASRRSTRTYATDDIDGANDRNASLIINMNGGDIYYLIAYSFNCSFGYTLNIGYNTVSNYNINVNTSYSMNISSDSYQMVKFTPTYSEYYDIYTQARVGDPQLYLFSSTGNFLNFDDDSLQPLNSLIRHYMTAGTTYYIAGQGYDGDETAFSIKITPSISGRTNMSLNNIYSFSGSSSTAVYAFIAPYTDSYDFYTFDRTSGDPYLDLYDSNREKIASNDDSNGNLNSRITINLIAGRTYYIRLRGLSVTTTTSCKLSVRLSIINRSNIYTSVNSSAHVINNCNEVIVFKFTAEESKYYTIYTNNIADGDPYLLLMNSHGIVVDEDDDSGHTGLNAKINFYSETDEIWYIIASEYDSSIVNEYDLIIN